MANLKHRPLIWQLLLLGMGPVAGWLAFHWTPDVYEAANGMESVLGLQGRATLAMMVWMSIWWLTETTDITVTALLPIVMFPFLGIATTQDATKPYADPVVFLFMGGFILALSMQRWGLGKRIALWTLRLVGTKPTNIIGGFMVITAVFSAFVSNVATVAMMLPIAISVIGLLTTSGKRAETVESSDAQHPAFATCLLLAIAYSASIGGVATIIGTAPNVIMVSFLQNNVSEADRIEISFAGWMLIGTPLAAAMLTATWLLLTKILFRLPPTLGGEGQSLIDEMLQQEGPIKRGEWVTAFVFAITVLAWMTRPLLNGIEWHSGDTLWQPFAEVSDAGIAMAAAVVLFFIPSGEKQGDAQFVMDWSTARELPWNVLLLFGGGLSLAAAVKTNGVAEYLGSQLGFLSGQPEWLVVLAVTAVVVFITELTSNTATTASLLPVLAALAPAVGMHPAVLVIAAAVSASCAFMLPVATPPNAIVYGSGQITIRQMARAGLWINFVAIGMITLLVLYWVPRVTGIP